MVSSPGAGCGAGGTAGSAALGDTTGRKATLDRVDAAHGLLAWNLVKDLGAVLLVLSWDLPEVEDRRREIALVDERVAAMFGQKGGQCCTIETGHGLLPHSFSQRIRAA